MVFALLMVKNVHILKHKLHCTTLILINDLDHHEQVYKVMQAFIEGIFYAFCYEKEYITGLEWKTIQVNSSHIIRSPRSILCYNLNLYFKILRSQAIPITQNVQDISQFWLMFSSMCKLDSQHQLYIRPNLASFPGFY